MAEAISGIVAEALAISNIAAIAATIVVCLSRPLWPRRSFMAAITAMIGIMMATKPIAIANAAMTTAAATAAAIGTATARASDRKVEDLFGWI
jgi:hypothetical protein